MMYTRTICARPLVIALSLIWVGLLTACFGGNSEPQETVARPANLAPEITLYAWPSIVPQSVLDDFAAEYGITVKFIPFPTINQAMDEVKAGEQYDLVYISDEFLLNVIDADVLTEIDRERIPNADNISLAVLSARDPAENQYSLPFIWGATVAIIRTDLVDVPVSGWSDLFALGDIGKVAVRMCSRTSLGASLFSLGYSINSEDERELDQALDRLLTVKDDLVIVGTGAAEGVAALESGEVVGMVGWAGDVLLAEEKNLPVKYIYPAEGTYIWAGAFTIPKSSPHKVEAELLLDFLLRPEIGARVTNESSYAVTNQAAYPYIDQEILTNPVVFPQLLEIPDPEFRQALGDDGAALYAEKWERFMEALPNETK